MFISSKKSGFKNLQEDAAIAFCIERNKSHHRTKNAKKIVAKEEEENKRQIELEREEQEQRERALETPRDALHVGAFDLLFLHGLTPLLH